MQDIKKFEITEQQINVIAQAAGLTSERIAILDILRSLKLVEAKSLDVKNNPMRNTVTLENRENVSKS